MRTLSLEERMQSAMQRKLLETRHTIELFSQRLQGASPQNKLQGSFGYEQTADGKGICDVSRVKPGDEITIYLKSGKLRAAVTQTEAFASADPPDRE